MSLILSQLQLKDFWIEEIKMSSIVKPAGSGVPEDVKLNLVSNYQVADDPEDTRKFVATLRVEIGPEADAPGIRDYGTSIRISGKFEIHPKAKDANIENYKKNSAPSMLYGVGRGLIFMMSSMTRQGKLVVPSLDPNCFMNASEKQEAQPSLKEGKIIEKKISPKTKRKVIS